MANLASKNQYNQAKLQTHIDNKSSTITKRIAPKERFITLRKENILGPDDEGILTRSQVKKRIDGVVASQVLTRSRSKLHLSTKDETTQSAQFKTTKRKTVTFAEEANTKNAKKLRESEQQAQNSCAQNVYNANLRAESQTVEHLDALSKRNMSSTKRLTKVSMNQAVEAIMTERGVLDRQNGMDLILNLLPALGWLESDSNFNTWCIERGIEKNADGLNKSIVAKVAISPQTVHNVLS